MILSDSRCTFIVRLHYTHFFRQIVSQIDTLIPIFRPHLILDEYRESVVPVYCTHIMSKQKMCCVCTFRGVSPIGLRRSYLLRYLLSLYTLVYDLHYAQCFVSAIGTFPGSIVFALCQVRTAHKTLTILVKSTNTQTYTISRTRCPISTTDRHTHVCSTPKKTERKIK